MMASVVALRAWRCVLAVIVVRTQHFVDVRTDACSSGPRCRCGPPGSEDERLVTCPIANISSQQVAAEGQWCPSHMETQPPMAVRVCRVFVV